MALARTHILDPVLDRSLDIIFTRARTLDYALIHVLDRTLDRALDLARLHDLASTHERAFDFALASTLDLVPERIQDRLRTLGLPIQVSIDYELFYAWSSAELFAQTWWPSRNVTVRRGMTNYPRLIIRILDLAKQAELDSLMDKLTLPSDTFNNEEWQQFADKLYSIMQARDLVHDWQFTDKQLDKLNGYFYANELLVQCLNVAVVSDRQAILAGLLAPPKVD